MRDWTARRVRDLPPSGIRKFFELAQQIEGLISLGVGEPDFATPWHIREACIYSLEHGHTSYTSNQGLLELREHISNYYKKCSGLDYSPDTEILITTGVSEGVDLAMRAIIDPGDEIIVPEPCYVSYKACVSFAGGRPLVVPTTPENEFRLRREQLEKVVTNRTKALILSYPNNPTGAILERKDLEEIADFATEHDLLIISDEVYDQLTYNNSHTSIASLPGMWERTILLNGFSKAYSMTGLRLGYALGPPELIGCMTKIHQYTMLCAPVTAQMGAIEALRNGDGEVRKMVKEYNRRRKLIVKGLNRIGLPCFEPKGAFYAFPSIKNTGLTSEEFAEKLITHEKVAVVPGNVFGACGEGFIRCSYAASQEEIKEALERTERFLGKL